MLLPDRCYRFRLVRWALGGSWVRIPFASETDDFRTVEAFRHRCPWIFRAHGWMQIDDDDSSWLSLMVRERYGSTTELTRRRHCASAFGKRDQPPLALTDLLSGGLWVLR